MSRKQQQGNLVHRDEFNRARTHLDDLTGRREKVFALAWAKENEPYPHLRGQPWCSRLEQLCRTEDGKSLPITQDTATAVATIFQWLASPLGFTFLTRVLEKAGYDIVPKKKK